jgi:hypothetical protein
MRSKGNGNAIHGTLRKGLVTREGHLEGFRGENPGEETHRRAAVAAIDRFSGILKVTSASMDTNVGATRTEWLDLHSQRGQGVHCGETILTREKSRDLTRPVR